MGVYGDRLLGRLKRQKSWPPRSEAEAWRYAQHYRAFYENARDELKQIAGWTDPNRRYHVDPLAPKISEAFSNLQFREAPIFTPGAETDAQLLDDLIEGNQLPSELQENEEVRSAEGSILWRILSDPAVADFPQLEFHPRDDGILLFRGKTLKALAFVTPLDRLEGEGAEIRWRHLEVHDDSDVMNVLYRGNTTTIGLAVDLVRHPDVETLRDTWAHGLPAMMAGWVPNRTRRRGQARGRIGKSDYDGIEDFLLDLNEAATIGHENMRLTLKRRVVVKSSALNDDGELPVDQEALIDDEDTEDLGGSTGSRTGPWKVLEYTFDADALIKWQDQLARVALSRVGITPQFVGASTGNEGLAQTGTALRIRLIPAVNASSGKFQPWTRLPHMVGLLQLLDARSVDDGGYGRGWSAPQKLPGMKRANAIPEDPGERATRLTTLRSANLLSIETGVREANPDWDQTQVDDEVALIQAEKAAAPTGSLFGAGG